MTLKSFRTTDCQMPFQHQHSFSESHGNEVLGLFTSHLIVDFPEISVTGVASSGGKALGSPFEDHCAMGTPAT